MAKGRKLSKVFHESAEIRWERQRDAWKQFKDDDGNPVEDNGWPVGESEVEQEICILEADALVMRIEIWLGLFGGLPSRDQTGGVHETYDINSYTDARAHGQIQEATVTVYAREPKKNGDGFKKRIRLFERDRHHLAHEGWEATVARELAHPIQCPVGTLFYYVCRTSQKDRGAHTRATVEFTEL